MKLIGLNAYHAQGRAGKASSKSVVSATGSDGGLLSGSS